MGTLGINVQILVLTGLIYIMNKVVIIGRPMGQQKIIITYLAKREGALPG